MLRTRRLHCEEETKDKLYAALRELYRDGVRVYTGRLPASEVVRRKVDEKVHLRQPERPAQLDLCVEEQAACDPYEHKPD